MRVIHWHLNNEYHHYGLLQGSSIAIVFWFTYGYLHSGLPRVSFHFSYLGKLAVHVFSIMLIINYRDMFAVICDVILFCNNSPCVG